ncbi:GNAT family N-acetyltransferase [Brevibacillus ginsengisoli]|uniref:GNAT family N-acetyltransferase n=1 Tax=Brevibacillus ginsengisoli TaxID=363854 RepID=UPI003CF2E26C
MKKLETNRLLLRPFCPNDASVVEELAGNKEVADTTLSIPHPYLKGMALPWIESLKEKAESGELLTWAITLKKTQNLVGCISLSVALEHQRAELGYWLGRPYWGMGIMTEAAHNVIQFGFEELKLNQIFARAMRRNPASIRVMEKIGMKHEGILPQHVKKWGVYKDLVYYGILKD